MPNQTPESVTIQALYEEEPELYAGSAVQFMKASRRARVAVAALRAANMLRERCTCPSGDGSLRWPCPEHPPVVDDTAAISALREARAETWDEAISAVFAWWSAPPEQRPAGIVNPYGIGLPVESEGE